MIISVNMNRSSHNVAQSSPKQGNPFSMKSNGIHWNMRSRVSRLVDFPIVFSDFPDHLGTANVITRPYPVCMDGKSMNRVTEKPKYQSKSLG